MTVLETNLSALTLPLAASVLLLAVFSTCALAQTVVYGESVSLAFTLQPPRPNSLVTSTTIDYRLARPAHVALTVYDVLGREVVCLYNGRRPAGAYAATWDGRDGGGRRMGAGPYLVRLRAGHEVRSRQGLLLR